MTQQEEEREVFLRFAKAHPSAIALKSIESRNSPEPDIYCRASEGPIAFELVELLDSDEVRDHRRAIDLPAALRRAYGELPADHRRRVQQRVGDAQVNIVFHDTASATARERLIPKIIDFLATVDEAIEGEVPRQTWWKGTIKAMLLDRRHRLIGPLFYVSATPRCAADPTLFRIRNKFDKVYEGKAPRELLAYYGYQCRPAPEPLWRELVEKFLRENVGASQFRRVWLFDYLERRVNLVVPPLTTAGA
jgi:hypothetical protein